MTICKRLQYSGRVQGVGFRYSAHDLARTFAITGFVRNLPNGNVELVVEGPQEQVDSYLGAVARRMGDRIANFDCQDQLPAGLKDFQIRF